MRAAKDQSFAGKPALERRALVPLQIFWIASSTRDTCLPFGTNSWIPELPPTNSFVSAATNSEPRSDFNRQTRARGNFLNSRNSSMRALKLAMAVATPAGVLPHSGSTYRTPVASSTPTNMYVCCKGLFGNGPQRSTNCRSPGTFAFSSSFNFLSRTFRSAMTLAFARWHAGHVSLNGS